MIIEGILNVITGLLYFVLDLLPNIPDLPETLTSPLNTVLDLIFDNVGLLDLFLPLNIVKIIIPLWLVVDNFDKIYSIAFWIIQKIPMLGIQK